MMDNEVIIIANCQQTAINSSRVCLLPRSRGTLHVFTYCSIAKAKSSTSSWFLLLSRCLVAGRALLLSLLLWEYPRGSAVPFSTLVQSTFCSNFFLQIVNREGDFLDPECSRRGGPRTTRVEFRRVG